MWVIISFAETSFNFEAEAHVYRMFTRYNLVSQESMQSSLWFKFHIG